RDAQALPQPLRAAARARAVLPARLPRADPAPLPRGDGRVPGEGPRARWLPGLRARLPPVRRGRLGRVRLPLRLQHPRLRAQVRPPASAAAGASAVRGPELRDLLLL